MGTYFKDLSDAILSALKGMSVTIKHLFSKPVTVQYPDERLPIADAWLGRHKVEQSECTACNQCLKACPVDCLHQVVVRHGKVIEWKSFTVDYNHCMFCGLCVEACPTGGLVMTTDFDLSEENRDRCIVELLEWTGLRPEDLKAIEEANRKKEEKKKAAAAAKTGKEGAEKKGGGKKDGDPAGSGSEKEDNPPVEPSGG